MSEKENIISEKSNESVVKPSNDLYKQHRRKILIYSVSSYFLCEGSYKVVSNFAKEFDSFSTELPYLTELVVSNYVVLHYFAWLFILPALSLLRGKIGASQSGKVMKGSKVGFYIAAISFLVVFVSMLLPILGLSK